ncbi:MAG TPA: shikimate dehydrogenase [Mycobacteriales bacterium]|nr:shikimate dehydrogenase [Mycobacteriales bacterium]
MPTAAVIGFPIGHSRSPAIHRAGYAALDLAGWRYEAYECREGGLARLIRGHDELVGLSVTMPMKREALAYASESSELARRIGAANTLVRNEAGWYAHNTDVAGIVGALREAGVSDATGAIVLGAGGTAQAVLAALRDLGEPEPTVLVREPARALELKQTAFRLGLRPRVKRGLAERVDPAVYRAPLVISTLPKGAADSFADGDWTPGVLFDVIYDPWPTPLAAAAQEAGRTVLGGLDMLLHQAAPQFELFTGRTAPLEAMRAALA